MKAIVYTNQQVEEEREVSRKELLSTFNIALRDLRPVFSLRQARTIVRRGSCLIINLDPVKLIIGEQFAYIFNTYHTRVTDEFIPLLVQKNKKENPEETPFVFHVLEQALSFIVNIHKQEYNRFRATAQSILLSLSDSQAEENLQQLLVIKNKISKDDTRTKATEEVLTEILDDDNEMRTLCITSEDPHISMPMVESILENALEQIEQVADQYDELNENIDDTQEIITLKMASRRNRIITYDLFFTILSCSFAFGAVITGFFGMNLRNHMESSDVAFYLLGGGLSVFLLSGVYLLWRWMRGRGVV